MLKLSLAWVLTNVSGPENHHWSNMPRLRGGRVTGDQLFRQLSLKDYEGNAAGRNRQDIKG